MTTQRELFDQKAGELFSKQSSNAGMLSSDDYGQRAIDLEKWTSMDSINIKYEFPEPAHRARYYRMVKNGWFSRRTSQDDIELFLKDGDHELEVSHLGRLFDDLHKIHLDSNHRRGKTMRALVNKQFANVGRDYVDIYISTCHECSLRKAKLDGSGITLLEQDDLDIDDQTKFENALQYFLSTRVFIRPIDNATICCQSGTLTIFGAINNVRGFWQTKLTLDTVYNLFEEIGISIADRDLKSYAEFLSRGLQDDASTITLDDDGNSLLDVEFHVGGTRIVGTIKVFE